MKRLLFPLVLILALLVPTAAFGAIVGFNGTFPSDSNATISFDVKRVDGKNKKVLNMSVRRFNVNCTRSGQTQIKTTNPIDVNAPVQRRHWEYSSASTKFEGTFRKGNKNKADGTLEVTLRGVDFGEGPENCHGGPRTFHAQH
jgi:uncharacterized membrane protein